MSPFKPLYMVVTNINPHAPTKKRVKFKDSYFSDLIDHLDDRQQEGYVKAILNDRCYRILDDLNKACNKSGLLHELYPLNEYGLKGRP